MQSWQSTSFAAALAFAVLPTAARAGATTDTAAQCTAMPKQRDLMVSGMKLAITAASITHVYPDLPEVCQVEGAMAPNVGFRIALPMHNWNGKYLQGGCGGGCGTTKLYWCDEPLTRGYACASTDMGHQGNVADWNWALDNLQGRVDFGFRATHLAALIGKKVTETFYGEAPRRSYFMGCSTGGRQGLVEAQKFPADFDGIIAGAPPLNEVGSGIELAWNVLSANRPDGTPRLTESDVRLLHQAVVDACDMNDGVHDGLIGDPRQCKFDIETIACGHASSGKCLNADAIDAAKKLYSGPVDGQGRSIGHQGGVALGSELNWLGDYVPGHGRAPQYAYFIQEFLRYMAFDPPPGPGWKMTSFDFTRDAPAALAGEMLYDATNPDLRDFKARGGKMISYQGWSDTSVVPGGTVDYYEQATKLLGGPQSTQEFYRFFTIPGGRHCSSDGDGAEAVNWIEAIENWVERGQAPERLTGYHYNWPGPVTRALHYPLDASRIAFTRPVFLYPAVPRYIGHGDPKDAANYAPSITK